MSIKSVHLQKLGRKYQILEQLELLEKDISAMKGKIKSDRPEFYIHITTDSRELVEHIKGIDESIKIYTREKLN